MAEEYQKEFSAGLSLVNRKRTEPKKEFGFTALELELELIQTQKAQKPMLRAEMYARALRASQNAPLCLSTDIFVLAESY